MNNTTIILLLLGLGLFLNSCDDGLCPNDLCKNGGICNEGICDCLGGYYGEYCEKEYLCYNSNCGKNAFCDTLTGNCICFPGYTSCDSTYSACLCELREDLLGNYSAKNVWNNSCFPYYTSHRIVPYWRSADYIVINDFGGLGNPVNLPVKLINATQFVIPPYKDAWGRTFISGTDDELGNDSTDIGTYYPSSGVLKLTYNVVWRLGDSDVCEVTFYPL